METTLIKRLKKAFGGRVNLAAAACVHPSRVSRWGDTIPRAAMINIIKAAPSYGVEPSLALVAPDLVEALAGSTREYLATRKES